MKYLLKCVKRLSWSRFCWKQPYETGELSVKKVSYEKAVSDHLQVYYLQPKKKEEEEHVSDWNGDENAYAEVKE